MQIVDIESRDNPKIKRINKLMTSGRFRKENGLFAVEGLRLCLDATQSGYTAAELYFTARAFDKNESELSDLLSHSASAFRLSERLMETVSDTVSPQGVLCLLNMPQDALKITPGGRYIFLENLSDPSNLGAVSRTAEALGLDGILTSGGCDRYHPKALRASMGALVRFPVKDGDFNDLMTEIGEAGLPVFAAVPRNADLPIDRCDFSAGGVSLIGNEASGLSEAAISAARKTVTIPMSGRAESLNAATAAAIICYEMMKKV